eukprot:gene24564-10175_t
MLHLSRDMITPQQQHQEQPASEKIIILLIAAEVAIALVNHGPASVEVAIALVNHGPASTQGDAETLEAQDARLVLKLRGANWFGFNCKATMVGANWFGFNCKATMVGANWFGFNCKATMVDGMWNPSSPMSYDFATVIYRWQLLGFNHIRLPFSFKDLHQGPALLDKFNAECKLPTLAQVAATCVTPGDVAIVPPPQPNNPPPRSPTDSANSYLPNTNTLDRFVWVVQWLTNSGFYVTIDNHLEDPTVIENPRLWVQQWADLVQRLSVDPITKIRLIVDPLNEPGTFGLGIRLIVDPLNEPDGFELGWDSMADLYLYVMDAVHAVNPNLLFFIEGTGQTSLSFNWGDGFVTAAAAAAACGTLPHLYGPSICKANYGCEGSELYSRLSRSFGVLALKGYSFNGVTKRFPIAVAEWGSALTDPRDRMFMGDLIKYMNNEGDAIDGLHTSITSWCFWAWNDNSGDTGGLVDSTWVNIRRYHIHWFTFVKQVG